MLPCGFCPRVLGRCLVWAASAASAPSVSSAVLSFRDAASFLFLAFFVGRQPCLQPAAIYLFPSESTQYFTCGTPGTSGRDRCHGTLGPFIKHASEGRRYSKRRPKYKVISLPCGGQQERRSARLGAMQGTKKQSRFHLEAHISSNGRPSTVSCLSIWRVASAARTKKSASWDERQDERPKGGRWSKNHKIGSISTRGGPISHLPPSRFLVLSLTVAVSLFSVHVLPVVHLGALSTHDRLGQRVPAA